MKHIFIVNPAAGKENATEKIEAAVKGLNADCEIYHTKAVGDATEYVKSLPKNGEKYRIYACGGDGTLNEVASGAVFREDISVTAVPVGSGNDFVKYYGDVSKFSDIAALVDGVELPIDILQVGDDYAVNMVHFGFDTAVLKTMLNVRRKKIIGGKRAYTTGVAKALISGMKHYCTVKVDGKAVGNSKMLLCTVGNGKYVGGKYKCAPRSDNSDGLMEICHVGTVSRFNFLRLMGAYEKGTHLDDPRLDKYVEYSRGSTVSVDAVPGYEFSYSLDGELHYADSFEIKIHNKALNFVVPKDIGEAILKEGSKENVY